MAGKFSAQSVSTNPDRTPMATIVTGGPGVGKTHFLSTIDGIFMIPVEDGMKGASPHHTPAKFMDEHGRCILPDTFAEFIEELDVFHREVNRPAPQPPSGAMGRPHRHLGIDSLTGIERLVNAQACGAERAAHMEDKDYKKVWSAALPYWEQVQARLGAIRRSGVNVWLIAHAEEDYDASESTGEVFRKSDLAFRGSGKTLGDIRRLWRGWADNIFYIQRVVKVKKGDKTKRAMADFGGRVLVTQETARCAAKSRMNLPPTMPATWLDLQRHLRAGIPASAEKLLSQIQAIQPTLQAEDRELIQADLQVAKTPTQLAAVLSRAQGMAELARVERGEDEADENASKDAARARAIDAGEE